MRLTTEMHECLLMEKGSKGIAIASASAVHAECRGAE